MRYETDDPPIGKRERETLDVLDSVVRAEPVLRELDAIARRLEDRQAADSAAILVWQPVELSLYGRPAAAGYSLQLGFRTESQHRLGSGETSQQHPARHVLQSP